MIDDAALAERFYGNQGAAPAAPLPSPESEIAERLFAKPEPPAVSSPAPASTPTETPPADERAPLTEQEAAENLFGEKAQELPEPNLPPGIKELRESDEERRMFSPQGTFAETLPDSMLAEVPDLDDKTKAAAVHEFRELAADLDLSPIDVRGLIDRASLLGKEAPDPSAQQDEAVAALNAAFGDSAYQAWQDARALVARDPRVGQIIDALGLGDDPQTVMLLAHAARRQRTAGKLK